MAALAVVALGGCTTASAPTRAAPTVPTLSAFTPGLCRSVAEPVRTLGEFTWRHGGGHLTTQDRQELRPVSERLMAARKTATPADHAVSDQIATLVATVGSVRLLVAATDDSALLRDLEAARVRLQSTCTH